MILPADSRQTTGKLTQSRLSRCDPVADVQDVWQFVLSAGKHTSKHVHARSGIGSRFPLALCGLWDEHAH